MADTSDNSTPRGWRRAVYDWLVGSPAGSPASEPLETDARPVRIGHYTLTRKLGEGGMGIVFAARDERLERTVALKTMSSMSNDETARRRFWREARAAASVNHPNICHIHEIGEDGGTLFIAMELLEGESLADRLRRGPVNVQDAIPIALGILNALSALHARGIVHRDLKPSNVFLTPHGVKVLDFGLARPELEPSLATAGLTRTGIAIGTPRYMSPEQVGGDIVDARCDLFAAGAILFEMLAGRPAFGGRTVVDILHATLHEQPPALTGPAAVTAADRIIRRALAKAPADRPYSADEMAEELRGIPGLDSGETTVLAQALTRLVVLPFRILRPDPETDFLAFSLPDAIATSLARVRSLIVRSTATTARFASETPDLTALAVEAGVDRVVMGTLIRSGDQLRVTAQLVEAPGGTLLTSETIQSSLGDLFRLQDDLAHRVVTALSLPLGGQISPPPDAPRSARAYEFYLRGNELARTYSGLPQARDLYLQALALDPTFAPAWAHLGRCHRVIGKFIEQAADSPARAEDAFRRALAIDPRLSVAHKYYAQLESDIGQTHQALVRLLGEATQHGNDPELFAGLVHSCRYCGLYRESLAAHDEARRLDPNVATSVDGTLLMLGDYQRLGALDEAGAPAGVDEGLRVIAVGLAGRRDQARQFLESMRVPPGITAFDSWKQYLSAWLDHRTDDMVEMLSRLTGLHVQDDPEAMFLEGWLLCDAGDPTAGFVLLERAVAKGYCAAEPLSSSKHFDPLRSDARFEQLVAAATARRERALAAFCEGGGERLLGRR